MAVHRERVDPLTDEEDDSLVHRRWILPDDQARPVSLAQVCRLWRGLFELAVLEDNDQVMFERLPLPLASGGEVDPERRDIPASASAGLLLAGAASATLVTQVVRLDQGQHRDPYLPAGAPGGELDQTDWRDYTLYAVEHDGTWLVPIGVDAISCGACGSEAEVDLPWFGEAQLLEISAFSCPGCKAPMDASRDKATLASGDVFLLEEVCCKAALSVELPEEPASEELPDAAVVALLREAFGGIDELTHDGCEPA